MEKVFKGSLGFTKHAVYLFMSGFFFVVTTINSINYIWDHGFQNVMHEFSVLAIPVCLLAFTMFYFICALENYTLRFSDNKLTIKNYFIGIEEVFKYEDINEIKITGALVPIGQKHLGIRMNIETKQGKKSPFTLNNFDRDEIKMIFKTLEKIGIPYHHNSISTAK